MHFDISDRGSATASFKILLRSSRIPLKRRQVLNGEFDRFRGRHEEQFWTTRALKLDSKKSAQRLACVAQDAAVDEASAAYNVERGFYDDDRPDQHGNTNDAYDDDVNPDSEYDAQKNGRAFADNRERSLQRRYSSLGEKWTLKSGTVVEDILFKAGKQMK
ncbi:hypothetical protein BG011_004912, partial [Mortierella polycephala]